MVALPFLAWAVLAAMPTTEVASAAGSAQAVRGPVQVTPGAAYPRGVATPFTAHVVATEGASFTPSISGTSLTGRFTTCSVTNGAHCVVLTSGAVLLVGNSDGADDEDVDVTLTGTLTPANTIPLASTEGAPMQPSLRAVTVTAAPRAPTVGATAVGVATVPVTTNPAVQEELALATTTPVDGAVVDPGAVVQYRATLKRTGNRSKETVALLDLVRDSSDTYALTLGTGGEVHFVPGEETMTVGVDVHLPADAKPGVAAMRLRVRWGADIELGAIHRFRVTGTEPAPAPAPAPSPSPGPGPVATETDPGDDTPAPRSPGPSTPTTPVAAKPGPIVLTGPLHVAPEPSGGGDASEAENAGPTDTTWPQVRIDLLAKPKLVVRPGVAPVVPLRYGCPRTELRCTMVATITWAPRRGAKPIRLGTAKLTLASGKSGRSTVRLTYGARKLIAKHRLLRALLTVSTTDAAGNVSHGRLALTFQQAPNRRASHRRPATRRSAA